MARKKHKSRNKNRAYQERKKVKRDDSYITSSRLFRTPQEHKRLKILRSALPADLTFDDRRFYNPDPSPRRLDGRRATFALSYAPRPLRPSDPLTDPLKWVDPRRVMRCVRRKMRKEVLHALHIRGGSGSIRKTKLPNRRDQYSDIHC